MLKKHQKNKIIFTVTMMVIVGSFLVGNLALAANPLNSVTCAPSFSGDWLQSLKDLGTLFNPICWANWFLLATLWFEGIIISLLIAVIKALLTLNQFTNASAVKIGWTTIRDLSNMLFVLILLAIAIGTILRIESYNLKKALPRVVIMAVAVNFSLLIFGLITDFAQVIMATFVASFHEKFAQATLLNALGLDNLLIADNKTIGEALLGQAELLLSLVFAVIMMLIAIMVVSVMLIILLNRTVMLWILAVLSPLPYVLSAFPQGKKYASMWWSEFIKYVTIGPALAFFLWLSLSVMTSTDDIFGDPEVLADLNAEASGDLGSITTNNSSNAIFTEASTPDNMLRFLIGISMLLGGLILTQRSGVAGAGLAGSAYNKIKSTGLGAAGLLSPATIGSWVARKSKAGAVPFIGKFTKGIELNPANIARNIQASLEGKKEEDILRGNLEAGNLLKQGGLKGAVLGIGAQEWGDNYLKGFMFHQGVSRVLHGKAGLSKEYAQEAEKQEAIANSFTKAELDIKVQEKNQAAADEQRVKASITDTDIDLNTTELNEAVQDFVDSLKEQADLMERTGAKDEDVDKIRVKAASIEKSIGADNKLDLKSITDADLRNEVAAVANNKADDFAHKVESITKEIDKKTPEGKTYTEEEREKARKKAEKLRTKEYRSAALTPQDVVTRGARRAAFEEQRKKFGDTTNENELMAAFRSAVQRGELTEAGGIALQATKVGHLNELVNDSRAEKEYYFDKNGGITSDASQRDKTGKYGKNGDGVAFRKGEGFSSDINGFNAFIQDVFKDQLGASEQLAFSLQNDLSNIAESVNHWTFGQAITTDSDGIYRQNNKSNQQLRTYVEMGKADYENLSRRGNRLAWMTESWIDQDDRGRGKEAVLNDVGIDSIASNYKAMNANFGRSRVNKNFVLNLVNEKNMEILKQIGDSITNAKDQAEWKEFMRNVRTFAGKAAKEKEGSLAQKAAKELAAAENIRSSISGVGREAFVLFEE